jgi:hypothetical protein
VATQRYSVTKHDRETTRLERQARKQRRREARAAAKLAGDYERLDPRQITVRPGRMHPR